MVTDASMVFEIAGITDASGVAEIAGVTGSSTMALVEGARQPNIARTTSPGATEDRMVTLLRRAPRALRLRPESTPCPTRCPPHLSPLHPEFTRPYPKVTIPDGNYVELLR